MSETAASLANVPARERFAQLHEVLRDRICLLDYPPGTRLSEEALAEEFGVSRTPLRRVLNQLEAEGLIKSLHGVGTIVTDIDLQELTQVYQLRMELAVLIGKLTPVPPSQETLALLRDLYRRSQALGNTPDIRAFARLNMDVFDVVMRLCGNEPLREVSERLFYQTARIWLKSIPHMDFVEEVSVFSREISEILAAAELGDLQAIGYIRYSHLSMSFIRLKTKAQS